MNNLFIFNNLCVRVGVEEESFKMEVMFEEMIHSFSLYSTTLKVKILFSYILSDS